MEKRDQDKLLTPPTAPQESNELKCKRQSNWLVPSLFGSLAFAGMFIAYLLGQQSNERPSSTTIVTQPVKSIQSKIEEIPIAKPRTDPEKPIQLLITAIKSSDSEKLDMGCSCGFTANKNEYLIVSSETAIFRVNGDAKICQISTQEFEDLYDNEGDFNCGSYKVAISGRGEVIPGYDGYSQKARLRIEKDSLTKVMSGKWLCGC
ncbi:hypothetical protein LPB140_02795 [Sphingorhabdus lutea]|uniref:Uncharacterized protein n=1 Tax=Sphingorhabdus lutea TaxID=1913578 RepID=A0A1L3J9Y4_9SPHN|nr:hypothetical protein [Sphingorhabdus lutea]APG61930.1 hypothetical protein LPB140_02795 [Sphingorhabdus lutea]